MIMSAGERMQIGLKDIMKTLWDILLTSSSFTHFILQVLNVILQWG